MLLEEKKEIIVFFLGSSRAYSMADELGVSHRIVDEMKEQEEERQEALAQHFAS